MTKWELILPSCVRLPDGTELHLPNEETARMVANVPELVDICKRVARSGEVSDALKKAAQNTLARTLLKDWMA